MPINHLHTKNFPRRRYWTTQRILTYLIYFKVKSTLNSYENHLLLGGESLFLRKLVLGISAQASSKNLTWPLMRSAPQTSCVRATSPRPSYAENPGNVALAKWRFLVRDSRRAGCFVYTYASRYDSDKTTALRLLGTTSPRVRSPWLAAFEELKALWVSRVSF